MSISVSTIGAPQTAGGTTKRTTTVKAQKVSGGKSPKAVKLGKERESKPKAEAKPYVKVDDYMKAKIKDTTGEVTEAMLDTMAADVSKNYPRLKKDVARHWLEYWVRQLGRKLVYDTKPVAK